MSPNRRSRSFWAKALWPLALFDVHTAPAASTASHTASPLSGDVVTSAGHRQTWWNKTQFERLTRQKLNEPALGCAALSSLWDRSCEQHTWGCMSRPPSAAGPCRPEQRWPPALVSCAALWPAASSHTTPAADSQTIEHRVRTNSPIQCSILQWETSVQANVTLAWRVRDQCQSARSVCLASLRLCCSCSREGNQCHGYFNSTISNHKYWSDKLSIYTLPFKSLGSPRKCCVFHENSLLLPSHWKCGRLCFDRRVFIYLFVCVLLA